MNSNNNQSSQDQWADQGDIEMLKVIRNRVIQDAKGPEGKSLSNPVEDEASAGSTVQTQDPTLETESLATLRSERDEITEASARKFISVERAEEMITQDLARVEKLQLSLTEQKKQLESKRNKLREIKNKLTALSKEIDDMIQQL